ncbi:MAG TPA: GGDEF domain-containing protein [Rugosimonospora sp.]|jgi:diguanylate cyclase (GGDEF)-like protein
MIAITVVAFEAGWFTGRPGIRRLRERTRTLRGALTAAAWQIEHDHLTCLLSRQGLITAFADWQNRGQAMVVVFLDLDNFKAINDDYSHDTGDEVLHIVGDRLYEIVDLHAGAAARLSGDEFAVLLPVRDRDIARLLDEIVSFVGQPINVAAGGVPIVIEASASAGACWATLSDSLPTALDRADTAMYNAKHARQFHVFYEPGMTKPAAGHRRGARPRDRREQRTTS